MFPIFLLFDPDDQGLAQAIYEVLMQDAMEDILDGAYKAARRDLYLRTFQWWN